MRIFSLGFICALIAVITTMQSVANGDQAIVIAHRGASGYLPEHTLGAYQLAIEQGADFIEPDLVVTKDGHLIARHDVYLSASTDIASRLEFADRKRTLNGKEDWFVFDFTLAEIKQLKAIQPRTGRGQEFDGKETIPTLPEILELVRKSNVNGVNVGLYIELKRPDIFERLAPGFTDRFIDQLNDLAKTNIPLFFQCFDGNFLLDISKKTAVPLILLVGGERDKKSGWIKPNVSFELFFGKVAGYGLNKALLVNKDGSPSGILQRLKANGSKVHVWTVRDDNVPEMFQSVQQELKLLYSMGVDGVFADFPDTALNVRRSMSLIQEGPF